MTSRQTNRRSLRLAILLLSGSALAGVPLAALADSAWLGGASNDWFDASNWSPAAVPTAADGVLIDLNANAPVIASGATTAGLTVGEFNTATLNVSGGTLTTHGIVSLGLDAGSNGSLILQGGSTLLMDSGTQLQVGAGGTGVMTVSSGSTAHYDAAFIGANDGAGQLEVTGAGSVLTGNNITIGARNSLGSLIIDSAAVLQNAHQIIVGDGGTGTMDVTGTGTIASSETLYIGTAGIGDAVFENGAMFNNAVDLVVGGAAPAAPGSGGSGTLTIQTGATVLSSGTAEIGLGSGYTGTATVDGAGSNWQIVDGLSVGSMGGNGTLTVSNQGSIISANLTVGTTAGSIGTVTVQDPGSQFETFDMVVGGGGAGTLNVWSGAVTGAGGKIYIGEVLGGVGTVNVDGANSEFDPNRLFIGGNELDATSGGTGTLNVTNGASVLAGSVSLGLGSQSTGTVTVDGTNSFLQSTGDIVIGSYGAGTVNVTNAGAVGGQTDIYIGTQAGSSGTVNVSGLNSDLAAGGTLHIGVAGAGTINLDSDGRMTVHDLTMGETASSTGSITIGNNASAAILGVASVGVYGTGTVTVQSSGGEISATDLILGEYGGSHGTVIVSSDMGLSSVQSDAMIIGDAGTGILAIGAGGFGFTTLGAVVGSQSGSNGTLTVDGAGANWQAATGGLAVGVNNGAVGTVKFSNAGSGSTAGVTELGVFNGSTGTLTVTDAGSEFDTVDDLFVGEGGTGTLNIQNGGLVHAEARTFIGEEQGATGTLAIDGAGSVFNADANIYVGGDGISASGGDGVVTVTNGGVINDAAAFDLGVAPGATGRVTVDGVGSSITAALIADGAYSDGRLLVTNGGTVTTPLFSVGAIATGYAIVNGAGSTLTGSQAFVVGDLKSGTLQVTAGGTASAAAGIDVAMVAGSTGVVNIGGAAAGPAAAPGILDTPTVRFGAGTGSLNFNHTSANYTFAPALVGAGAVNQIAGVTFLSADSSGFTGVTNITGGELHVNGSLKNSTIAVSGGGTLAGNGTVGAVSVASGGIVAPGNSIGALTVNGNYSAASGSIYQVQLDSAGHSDLLTVTGTATLANGAALNVTKIDAAGYVPGTYKLLSAAGGVSGTYVLTGDVIQQSAFAGEKLSYDANDVYLNVSKTASFASAGITPNQIAVGSGADSLPTTSPLYGVLVSLPTFAAAQGAFDQLSGEIHASAKTAELEDSRLPREAALGRLSTAFAVGGTGSEHPAPWGQVYGSWGSTDANGNAAALGRSSRGFLGGVDLPVYDMWRVGILGGYSRGSFNVKDRNSFGTSDNYHLGGYTGLQDGALGVRFGVVYSWHDLTTDRTVNFAGFNNALASEYNAGTTQGFGEVGYHVPVAKVDLEPFANLAYVSLHTDAFAETGGAAALTAAGNTENTVFTTLGLRGKYDITLGNTLIGTHGSVGWRHAFGDLTPSTAMSFAGSSAFTIQGVPLAQDGAAFGAGFDLSVAKNVLLGISYDGQYAASAHDDTIKLNIGWKL